MSIDEMGLTQDEREVMDRLMDAYRLFHRLTKEHPDELRDFVDGLHRCQDVLAVRVCRRIYPKGWPQDMKIIRVDNFDRESKSDVLVAEKVNSSYGSLIVKLLNQSADEEDFFKLVEDKFKLYEFKP
ncbi:MAG: hypothetical protein MUP27_08900 [Desulfobacterales bacterium]|nr:hypothetical protein [Desulfobacterales bacterium]